MLGGIQLVPLHLLSLLLHRLSTDTFLCQMSAPTQTQSRPLSTEPNIQILCKGEASTTRISPSLGTGAHIGNQVCNQELASRFNSETQKKATKWLHSYTAAGGRRYAWIAEFYHFGQGSAEKYGYACLQSTQIRVPLSDDCHQLR
jgi:hypothetical protein